ncbi:protein ENHANCED DISEASE RESISTANCE 2-like isoform X1 [Dendrobium catenatum]|uniref:protein ENHANCED DISEASE RESISTANCE 2-like isoform X1 n=1 Tax=Dendrobium catenatum TaxID=906689 RepID=UPI0009F253E7|nr:protein ENHANCED DISEASE RESISTANCE 2-like isoform X1 [Dendrobium catenatum]
MSSGSQASDDHVSKDAAAAAASPSDRELQYSGWVYHLGVNSIGHEYFHLRFLCLRGNWVVMYKRDPHDDPGTRPIRKGFVSHSLMVEELGRKEINSGEFYAIRFYNRLDETKKGEIACATAGEARKWMEAFDQAKQLAANDILNASNWHKLSADSELNFEGHRPRMRRYARDLKRLIRIGKGPEMLLQKTSELGSRLKTDRYLEGEVGDAMEAHEWRCIRTINGIRIFEEATSLKSGKDFLLKSVGVIDANVDTVFEVVLSLDRHKRHEWDMLTGDLELLESVDGHYDVVYGIYDPKHLTWSSSRKDFVFSRQWFRGQDGEYTILQFPAVHKKQPPRPGYERIKVNPSIWEISRLKTAYSATSKCLVTRILEIHSTIWDRLKKRYTTNFEKTIPYALLCQVGGLREYFAANPSLALDSPSTVEHSNIFYAAPTASLEPENSELNDEFHDAIAFDGSLGDEDSDSDDEEPPKAGKVKLKNVSWAIASLALKKSAATGENNELDTTYPPATINPSQFHGSLHQGKGESDTNCWTKPSEPGFMIRGRTYLKDCSKVPGGDPLLKLLAVDWLSAETCMDKIAHHPNRLVQSESGKKLPFILVINLEIPAKPYYSLVLYYGADRPINKQSLLGRFIEGSDVFRDSRFKLIPSIVEGYWMVKRAVGTKACLLGKAVTCRYLREDNFLEIDVDIGSSSVARHIIGLVLGYTTGIAVDLAILIEAKEENELPEYILGTVRLNRLRLDSAVPYP